MDDQNNLYVKDLPGGTDELYVYRLFSPFGALESVTVKTGGEGTWAIAFVKFFDAVEASNACLGLNNCLLPDGTNPKVSVKTKSKSWDNPKGGKGGDGEAQDVTF